MGDLHAAEEAFRQAHELGRDPQPGLALVRLAEGKLDVALTAIRRTLADESTESLPRAKLLPACAEIALAASDTPAAQAAVEELEAVARTYGTPALEAGALYARGALHLARGDAAEAIRSLRKSLRLWQEVDVPYETARARVQLAAAYRAAGDEGNATLELESARAAFEHLGAVPDARRAAELLGGATAARSGPAAAKTFMFTDMVQSTTLVDAIGDEAWQDVRRWHDQTLRALFARHSGEEIDHMGDGFLVAFDRAADAVECAVAIQRSLAEHRRSQGFAPQVRIGLHAAAALREGRTYVGKGVHAAARIMALAGAAEIVASRETLAGVTVRFPVSAPRAVALKGIAEVIDVVGIGWQ